MSAESKENRIEEAVECVICLEPMDATENRPQIRLDCNHLFHTECITQWNEKGTNTCPQCRHRFKLPIVPKVRQSEHWRLQSPQTVRSPLRDRSPLRNSSPIINMPPPRAPLRNRPSVANRNTQRSVGDRIDWPPLPNRNTIDRRPPWRY